MRMLHFIQHQSTPNNYAIERLLAKHPADWIWSTSSNHPNFFLDFFIGTVTVGSVCGIVLGVITIISENYTLRPYWKKKNRDFDAGLCIYDGKNYEAH